MPEATAVPLQSSRNRSRPEATAVPLQSSRNRSRNVPLLDLDLDEIGWTLNESDYIAIIATGEILTAERN